MKGRIIKTSLGTFMVTSDLNWGGQGMVYNTNDSQYLLKVCDPFDLTLDESKKVKQDTIKRYRTFARLKFGNDQEMACLPLEYIEVDNNGVTPAYIMRRAGGKELSQSMKTIKGLDVKERYRIARSLANTLSLLHSRQVVHADFKPDNFFFNDSGLIQIIDIDGGGYFGAEPDTEKFPPATIPNDRYRSPDISRWGWSRVWQYGRGRLQKQPDLWSLAVLLYQILVDTEGPFPTKNDQDDPRHDWFRPGEYALDRPQWPRPWQREAMRSIGLESRIILLFESVFKTENRARIDDPRRPDALNWRKTLDESIRNANAPSSGTAQKKPQLQPTKVEKKTKFKFTDGEEVEELIALVKKMDGKWRISVDSLYQGEFAIWLREIGQLDLATTADEIVKKHAQDRDVGLEIFIQKVAAKLNFKRGLPELDAMPRYNFLGKVAQDDRHQLKLTLKNKTGQGCISGTAKTSNQCFSITPQRFLLSPTSSQSAVFNVTFDGYREPGLEIADIIFEPLPELNMGRVEVFVSGEIKFPRNKWIAETLRFSSIFAIVGLVLAFICNLAVENPSASSCIITGLAAMTGFVLVSASRS